MKNEIISCVKLIKIMQKKMWIGLDWIYWIIALRTQKAKPALEGELN